MTLEAGAPTAAIEPRAYERQLRDMQRRAARNPDDLDLQLAVAMLATIVGAYADAIEPFQRALEITKDEPDWFWLYMGIAAARTGRHEDALLAFSHVAEAAAEDPTAWVFKAMALENLGRIDEKQEALEYAAALEPHDAMQMVMVGFALGGLERYDEALEIDDRATAADPGNAAAWANKGTHLVARGPENAEAAIEAFQRALDCCSGDEKVLPTILRNYGIALVELGRADEALQLLKRARELDPKRLHDLAEPRRRLLELEEPRSRARA